MKKNFLAFFLLIAMSLTAGNINRIEPVFWYVGMNKPQLQLMVYGDGISKADVKINYPGVSIDSLVYLDSPNYLFIYLNLNKDAKPGTMKLTFKSAVKSFTYNYELRARNKAGNERKGFDMSDVIYLIMPDRFSNGNPQNDVIKGMPENVVNRSDPNGRHGGDLAGIQNHLDYLNDLGITAIWLTPVLENNMDRVSYHGYSITDFYNIDRRLGTNDEYLQLVEKAHEHGIKVIMDMVFNHCGSNHPWLKDMPSKDWFNYPDYKNNFVRTNYQIEPNVDPYASKYDKDLMNNGWFDTTMPDLNQRNPHLYRYLVQFSKWWIEYAGIDGIRMDTHSYADFDAMSNWQKELNDEYPNFNTVGEVLCPEPALTAWWQKDSKLAAPLNSNLKTVMDFSFEYKINQGKNEFTTRQNTGLDRIYNSFMYDYLYPDTKDIMALIENHDTDRFLGDGEDLSKLKQAIALLLTTHRIPQLYYGTEVLLNGRRTTSDGFVRKDFPGGWKEDKADEFTVLGRSEKQNECFEFHRRLLQWRKGNEVISKGTMIQFLPENGIYAFARQYNGRTVFVALNGTDNESSVDMNIYKEVLNGKTSGCDVITNRNIDLSNKLIMSPRQSLIVEL